MIGTSDQSCWLAEACKILLLPMLLVWLFFLLVPSTTLSVWTTLPMPFRGVLAIFTNADLAINNADQHAKVNEVPQSLHFHRALCCDC